MNHIVGSSPLARGTRGTLVTWTDYNGLIPARAGNTSIEIPCLGFHGAHPRSRGEHNSIAESIGGNWGSSPLARGTHSIRGYTFDLLGLIPARAGNTAHNRAGHPRRWAHPRSRGEHKLKVNPVATFLGSSPLARGTLGQFLARVGDRGLIPARAGNTHWTVTGSVT